MKHEHRFRKLGRKPAHRRDLLRTMLAQLIIHEQIVTTTPKAKEIAKRAEKVRQIESCAKDALTAFAAYKLIRHFCNGQLMDLARRNTNAARESAYWSVYVGSYAGCVFVFASRFLHYKLIMSQFALSITQIACPCIATRNCSAQSLQGVAISVRKPHQKLHSNLAQRLSTNRSGPKGRH